MWVIYFYDMLGDMIFSCSLFLNWECFYVKGKENGLVNMLDRLVFDKNC